MPRTRSISPPPSPIPEPTRLKEILREMITWFVQEIRESGSSNVLEKEIIDPMLQNILNKLLPYIITSSIVFLVVIVGIILILTWLIPKIGGFSIQTNNDKTLSMVVE